MHSLTSSLTSHLDSASLQFPSMDMSLSPSLSGTARLVDASSRKPHHYPSMSVPDYIVCVLGGFSASSWGGPFVNGVPHCHGKPRPPPLPTPPTAHHPTAGITLRSNGSSGAEWPQIVQRAACSTMQRTPSTTQASNARPSGPPRVRNDICKPHICHATPHRGPPHV